MTQSLSVLDETSALFMSITRASLQTRSWATGRAWCGAPAIEGVDDRDDVQSEDDDGEENAVFGPRNVSGAVDE